MGTLAPDLFIAKQELVRYVAGRQWISICSALLLRVHNTNNIQTSFTLAKLGNKQQDRLTSVSASVTNGIGLLYHFFITHGRAVQTTK